MLNKKTLSVIIPVRGTLAYLQNCISQLRKNISPSLTEILIINNCEDNATTTWLKAQSDLTIIEGFPKQSVPASYNIGLKQAKGESILLLHSDTIMPKNTVERLETLLYSNEKIAATAPVSTGTTYKFQQPQQEILPFNDIQSLERSAASFHLKKSLPIHRLFLEDFCFLLKRTAYEKIGMFDEQFSPHYLEIADYSLRLLKEGYLLTVAEDTFVAHIKSATINEYKLNFDEIYSTVRNKFINKWHFDFNYFANVRPELINNIDLNKTNLSVLDVGCASGGNFAYIKSFNPSARLCGIEFNEHAASIASLFAEVRAADVETIQIPEWENSFDYIILADVLEHLREPEEALKNLKRLLKSGGKLIISVPNIAFFGIIHQLLSGRFRYEDMGILDRTHLRFFTRSEMLSLLKKTGYHSQWIGGFAKSVELPKYEQDLLAELKSLPGLNPNDEDLLYVQHFFMAEKK